jgi:zinc protease
MNNRTSTIGISTFIITAAVAGQATAQSTIPAHPDDLQFEPLIFSPPSSADYRHELPGDIPVYMAPTAEFPLISLTLTFKGGEYLVGKADTGLGSALGSLMRTGGTTSSSPSQMDEDLDFLATQVSTSVGRTTSSAQLNCLKSNFDESLVMFMDIIRNPAFEQERLGLWSGDMVESMKQRNDDADSIMRREFGSVMAGDHFTSRQPTLSSVDGIDKDKLSALHQRIFHPDNLIVSVSGDFDPDEMMKKLTQAFKGWEGGDAIPEPPAPQPVAGPGVYRIEKDIPQGKVMIGTRSITRDDPDYFSFLLMNEILGGGAFTSRITSRVRSDEGLAYSAGSAFQPAVDYPGVFVAYFQSKSPTVALANKIIFEEFGRIRNEPVSPEELETARQSFIETFPQSFSSRDAMLGIFVSDEWTSRPDGYWQSYRDKVAGVTAEDIQRVAQKYLDPEEMKVMVIGRWDDIYAGDENGRATMGDIFKGQSTEMPLRDPLTLEP